MKLKKSFLVILATTLLAFSLTGCGNNDDNNNNSSNASSEDNSNSGDDNSSDDPVGDAIDGAGDAIGDMLGSGGFDNYDDAHDYFLSTMTGYNGDADYELRNETEDTTEFQTGSTGYSFELHDRNQDGDTRVGKFYVDETTGIIYTEDADSGNIIQYSGTNAGNSGTDGTTTGSGTNSTESAQ